MPDLPPDLPLDLPLDLWCLVCRCLTLRDLAALALTSRTHRDVVEAVMRKRGTTLGRWAFESPLAMADYEETRHAYVYASMPWPEFDTSRGKKRYLFGVACTCRWSFGSYTITESKLARVKHRVSWIGNAYTVAYVVTVVNPEDALQISIRTDGGKSEYWLRSLDMQSSALNVRSQAEPSLLAARALIELLPSQVLTIAKRALNSRKGPKKHFF